MLTPRRNALSLLATTILTCTSLLISGACTGARAQRSSTVVSKEREEGVRLYQQGDMKGAVKLLQEAVGKNQTDVIAWNHLALALARQDKKKEARKALKQLATLRVAIFQKEFDAVASAKMTEADVSRLELLLKEASDSIGSYMASTTGAETRDWYETVNELIFREEFLKLVREALARGETIKWSDVQKAKARILRKTEPQYTEEARQHQVSGTIMLTAVLATDGTVKDIRLVQGLGYGLNELAVEAARKIKFQPAHVGSHPVSQFVLIQYDFNLF